MANTTNQPYKTIMNLAQIVLQILCWDLEQLNIFVNFIIMYSLKHASEIKVSSKK